MPKPLISVGQLIDQSWEIYRSRISEYIGISGWLIIAAILYAVSLAFYPSATTLGLGIELSKLEIMGVLLFSFTSLILMPILSFWVYLALTKATGSYLNNRGMSSKTAMLQSKKVFFPTLLTSVMVVLMVVLAIVVSFAPPAILATLGALSNISAIIVLANILLVIGIFVAIYLSVRWVIHYILAPYVTILDGTKAKLALATSRQLIQGRFWSVLIRVTVPKLVFVIFGVFAMSIFAYLVSILIDASAGLNIDIQLRITTMTQTVVPILIAVLINPLIVISDVLLLKSLRQ